MILIRLWHYKLIPVLPKQMLVSQWRECIAIKRQWDKGTLKHRLVSYVTNYDGTLFSNYVFKVVAEMEARGIRYNKKYLEEIKKFCWYPEKTSKNYPEHNDRYLKQCFHNLQEKFDRGIITLDEYLLIRNQKIYLYGKERSIK